MWRVRGIESRALEGDEIDEEQRARVGEKMNGRMTMNRCLSSIYSNSYRLRILQFSTSCLPIRCWLKFESTRVLAKFTAARFTRPEELELCYVPVSNQGEKRGRTQLNDFTTRTLLTLMMSLSP